MKNIEHEISALLGPTNTGKTYLAIERMLEWDSGMVGFPLRLLARENYDRLVARLGADKVALITGEEKIVPASARFFMCTVESMPVDRAVDFLCVDEIQLAADPERGHVFTDRLLYARGSQETLFTGSDSMRAILQKLLPGIAISTRPRLSRLSYAGPKKVTRLPPRAAVIAFSAAEVYRLAELLRRQRGGTAVVLGALSPRTRNAQVELFESGQVDYLVASDAIGMGLNLGLDHVAFSALRKFDGRRSRHLTPAETAQIAGRAGRHTRDGTFGSTEHLGPLDPDLIEAIEEHRFDPVTALYWRNPALDFSSAEALVSSLDRSPDSAGFIKVRDAEDRASLVALLRDPGVAARARGVLDLKLLWDICQIPDFRQNLTDQHHRLLIKLFTDLVDEGDLAPSWIALQLQRLERKDGDIDAISARLAEIRTWTYITHRADWMKEAATWQVRSRAIEDLLSDALHERLTGRFVDRRTTDLVRGLKSDFLSAGLTAKGEVIVEGHYVGQLTGFHFHADEAALAGDGKAVLTAARRGLTRAIPQRVKLLEDDNDGAFLLDEGGRLSWRGTPVARLVRGPDPLSPQVEVRASEFLDGPQRARIAARLSLWLGRHLTGRLPALYALKAAAASGSLAGLLYHLQEGLGLCPRAEVAAQVAALSKQDRKVLVGMKLRLGRLYIYHPAILAPRSRALRRLLMAVWLGDQAAAPLPQDPVGWLVGKIDPRAAGAEGFALFPGKADLVVLVDLAERLLNRAQALARKGPFEAQPALLDLVGGDLDIVTRVLKAGGFRPERKGEGVRFRPAGRDGTKATPAKAKKDKPMDPSSPFAVLQNLVK